MSIGFFFEYLIKLCPAKFTQIASPKPTTFQATAKKEIRRDIKISSAPSSASTELPSEGSLPIQPDTVTHVMPDKTVVKTNDLRVTERDTLFDMVINVSPCFYNELKNEITEKDIAFMDRNLFLGSIFVLICKFSVPYNQYSIIYKIYKFIFTDIVATYTIL